MHTVGRHLLAEYYDCDAALLDDLATVQKALREAAALVGATVVGETFHSFAPHGKSGSLLIAESHVALHTWPEAAYAAADIYTCGELDPKPGVESLGGALRAKKQRMLDVVRGLANDIESPQLDLPANARLITQLAPVEPVTSSKE